MNQFTAQQKIELLDRKYEFLMGSSQRAFIYDLRNFVEFLKEDEIVKDYIEVIQQKFNEDRILYQKILKEEKDKLKIYANDATDVGREISAFIDNFDLDEIITPKIILNRLKDKLNVSHLWLPQEDDEFTKMLTKSNIEYVMRDCKYYLNEWISIFVTSAGKALEDLIMFLFAENPSFDKFGEEKSEGQIGHNILTQYIYDKSNSESVREAIKRGTVYSGIEQAFVNDKKRVEIDKGTELNNRLKEKVTRVYETIRQEIGSTRLRLTVLDRYKVRSQSYNKDYLRNLSKRTPRKSEDLLSKDLALYLFDQGFPVWYRVKRGQHEYDFIHPDAKNPLLIEVKVCKKSDRRYILQGLKQIHAYLSSCESEFQISEGYYVIFRLGGAVYELPHKLTTNRFTIYPIIIDLGESLDSGSKQVAPIQISLEEIEKELGQN